MHIPRRFALLGPAFALVASIALTATAASTAPQGAEAPEESEERILFELRFYSNDRPISRSRMLVANETGVLTFGQLLDGPPETTEMTVTLRPRILPEDDRIQIALEILVDEEEPLRPTITLAAGQPGVVAWTSPGRGTWHMDLVASVQATEQAAD